MFDIKTAKKLPEDVKTTTSSRINWPWADMQVNSYITVGKVDATKARMAFTAWVKNQNAKAKAKDIEAKVEHDDSKDIEAGFRKTDDGGLEIWRTK